MVLHFSDGVSLATCQLELAQVNTASTLAKRPVLDLPTPDEWKAELT